MKNNQSTGLLDGFLDEHQLARELNKHRRTILRWRQLGIGPPHILLGPQVVYPIAGTKAWLAAGGTAAAITGEERLNKSETPPGRGRRSHLKGQAGSGVRFARGSSPLCSTTL
jgi:hypothetical protein